MTATDRLSTTAPAVEAGRSLILALHARYEQALEDHSSVDEAEPTGDTPEKRLAKYPYERAMETLNKELDALRMAILYQVPGTSADAMILQYHIVEGIDMMANATAKNQAEEAAVEVAASTLFDFMAREDHQTDHEALGRSFKRRTLHAFNARRFRTGQVEA